MSIGDFKRFRELTNQLGSPYAAVNYISSEARKLANKYDNIILHSEAIDWVVTGEMPDILKNNKYKRIPHRKSNLRSYMDELLSYVDDEAVCESVRYSIYASKSSNHLIYVYKDVSDESRQTRVRVLTRMIWYNLNLYRR